MRPQFGRGYLPGPVTKTPRAATNMDGFFVSYTFDGNLIQK